MADDTNSKEPAIDPAIENLLNSLDSAPDNTSEPESEPLPTSTQPVTVVQPLMGTPVESEKPPEKTPIDRLIERFDNVSQGVLTKIESDRSQIEGFIQLFATQAQGDNPKSAYVEGLVSLQSIKADTIANSIKAMDSIAKMVAASKSIVVGPSGNGTVIDDLDGILNASIDDDAP